MPLLSISLDLVGSTEIKDQLSRFARENETNLETLYTDLANKMLLSMNSFMEHIDFDEVLEINRLFLVKRIGDEYWYVYDLKNLDSVGVTKHATHFVKVLLGFLSSSHFEVVATSPEESDDPYAVLVKPEDVLRKEILWKSTIDLISHAIDLSKLEEEKLEQFLAKLTTNGKLKGNTTNGDSELIELKNRLWVGFSVTKQDKVVYALRSDYIGVEVDRFFRISKLAKKGMVLTGESLLKVLMLDNKIEFGTVCFRDPIGVGSFITISIGISSEPINFSPCDLKGISGEYSGVYFYSTSVSAQPLLARMRRYYTDVIHCLTGCLIRNK